MNGTPEAFCRDISLIRAETQQETGAFRPAVCALRETPAEWLPTTLEKIEALLDLQQDWDSYGATPLDSATIDKASQCACFLAHFVGISAPVVGAAPDGKAGFSWDSGAWSLDVDISPTGRIHYVYIDQRDESCDQEAWTDDLYELVRLLTAW